MTTLLLTMGYLFAAGLTIGLVKTAAIQQGKIVGADWILAIGFLWPVYWPLAIGIAITGVLFEPKPTEKKPEEETCIHLGK